MPLKEEKGAYAYDESMDSAIADRLNSCLEVPVWARNGRIRTGTG